MILKPTNYEYYDWIRLCWCDFMAWTKWNITGNKQREKKKTTKKKSYEDKYVHNAHFLCCRWNERKKWKWRSIRRLDGESSWVKKTKKTFCRWRILSRFLHCLWTFYTVFICLFVRSFICLHVCQFANVWHAKRNVDYFCRIYRSFRSRLNLLFAWIFDWTNLSFGSLSLSLFLLFAE